MEPKKAGRRAGNSASLIYDRLRSDILSGKLAPGTPLSQPLIAKSSGTSRGPVREALRRLQQDNLVVARANQRFSIAPFDIADLEAVLSLHLANITLAVQVSVTFLTSADLKNLQISATAMEQALDNDDSIAWELAYREFITTIIKHTGERTLALVIQLIDDIQRYRVNLNHKVPLAWYHAKSEFRQIMKAVANREGALASQLYADYMSRLSSLILAGAAPAYDASRLRAYISTLSPGGAKGADSATPSNLTMLRAEPPASGPAALRSARPVRSS